MLYAISQIIKIIFLLVFPFVLLIRTSVYLHTEEALIPWACIGGGILYTSILLFLYIAIFYGRLFDKAKAKPSFKHKAIVAVALVFLYCLHGLFYMSSENFKNPYLKSEIRKIHPILRLSLSTLIHLDKGLIITDSNRVPEDYKAMGLKAKKHSLHYQQSNGYAHAVDLRTSGRNEFRNSLIQWYFKLMGFNTLRHGGTGDHLHVSLMSHDRPYAR